MKRVILLSNIFLMFATFGCAGPATTKEQKGLEETKKEEIKLLQKVYGDDYVNARINFSIPISIYGTSEKVNFIETRTSTESNINYTGKTYVVTNKNNDVLIKLLGNTYSFEKIFENENPFLVITEVTFKGNGIHHFYGMEDNLIKDFLNTDNWSIQTIGRGNLEETFVPKELQLTFKDINNDSFTDAVFSGESLNEITKKKSKIELNFIYDKDKKTFNLIK
ncbi:exported protein of unknown function [Tenacibaculum sp. 190130A14a]|uniref:Lipoprotein n=1 Tax=Tenacibaculum polynesiense TaxID=3137857 RepID=A0ABM9PGF8_9FLAO